MIARGDLGIEVAQEKIPGIQRRLIRKCVKAKKPKAWAWGASPTACGIFPMAS
jgi:pyruvate kinase